MFLKIMNKGLQHCITYT